MTHSSGTPLSDLGGKLFSKSNIQRTHYNFEKEHECTSNVFCQFFEVPTTYAGGAELEIAAADSDPVGMVHIL